MTSPAEHRYRRVLRLLPAGYRRAWEEDMVSAYMQSSNGGASGRPSFGERLSVMALAVRLWLAGSHASPRGHAWYQAVYAFALMVLLQQALWMTIRVAQFVGGIRFRPMEYRFDATEWVIEGLGVAQALLWIVVFGCAVMAWVVAARISALLAFGIMLTVYISVNRGLYPGDLLWMAWPALYVAAAFAIPWRARPSRRLWISVYVGASIVLAPAAALSRSRWDGPWLRIVDLSLAWRLGLLVGMIVVLATPALRRSAGWLIALAVFGIGTLPSLLGLYLPVPIYGHAGGGPLGRGLDVILIGLGVACAILGVRALRRLPRSVPGSA